MSAAFISSKKKTNAVTQKPQLYVQPTAVSAGSPPVVRRLFKVNSEPHTGARPSVRLCVVLINNDGLQDPRARAQGGSDSATKHSHSLPVRERVGLEVHRCLCIIDAGNVFISTVMG